LLSPHPFTATATHLHKPLDVLLVVDHCERLGACPDPASETPRISTTKIIGMIVLLS
jgi:hypothetical protein